MEILSAFHQPRSNYGNCEQTAGAIGNNSRTCRGFYADARENHTLYILQRYLLQLITAPIRLHGRHGDAPSGLPTFTGLKRIYGVNMSGVTKAEQNKGPQVTRRKGHGVPTAAKGGGGTPASVVKESDQSLLFNKDTETLKCCFMWRGSGFRARR